MISTERDLRAHALRSYELGRAGVGLGTLWYLAPILALALALGQSARMIALVGASLLATTWLLRWRGGVHGRAATAGLLFAAAPLVLPFAMRTTSHCCVGGACMSWCMIGCVAGGVLAGAGIGWAAVREGDKRWSFLLVATLISGLAGVLGCAVAGLAGTAGMALAIVGSSLPICWVARPRYSA